MRVGVTFPQTELGGDPGAVRAYGERTEELGYSHVLVYDHVVGADAAVHTGWNGPYDVHTTFHEPFVMYGFLAAVTQTLELVTGVIILPQRQTALVAKQAAEVDLLSGGRLRLGIGVGWNAVEYEALGEDFGNRGKRSAEQITLLRKFWTEQTVNFDGEFHHVTGAGLAPMPVQRPIPVWIGAKATVGYQRAGRVADGWFPMMGPGDELDEARAVVERAAVEAGRDPADIGMEGRVDFRGDVEATLAGIAEWEKAGATHLSVNTMNAGFTTVDDHLAALAEVAASLP
jgi:probable F420-dependent oxidoreductase